MPRAKLWNTETLIETFEAAAFSDHLEAGIELLKKQKIVDFIITPGRVNAKCIDEMGVAQKIEVLIDTFSEEDWINLLDRLSEEALYLSHLLCGNIPLKLETVCEELELELFPKTLDQIEMRFMGKVQTKASAPIAAVIHRFAEKLRDEHFLLFLLRGKGAEEIIANLKQRRKRITEKRTVSAPVGHQQLRYEDAPTLKESLNNFWSSGKGIENLSFTIKADELPASILKRLDPLPLGGIEEEIEYEIEEAYAQIARRAQGYGLGLEN